MTVVVEILEKGEQVPHANMQMVDLKGSATDDPFEGAKAFKDNHPGAQKDYFAWIADTDHPATRERE